VVCTGGARSRRWRRLPPNDALIQELAPGPGVGPAGLYAANLLRLSTQVPRRRAEPDRGRCARSARLLGVGDRTPARRSLGTPAGGHGVGGGSPRTDRTSGTHRAREHACSAPDAASRGWPRPPGRPDPGAGPAHDGRSDSSAGQRCMTSASTWRDAEPEQFAAALLAAAEQTRRPAPGCREGLLGLPGPACHHHRTPRRGSSRALPVWRSSGSSAASPKISISWSSATTPRTALSCRHSSRWSKPRRQRRSARRAAQEAEDGREVSIAAPTSPHPWRAQLYPAPSPTHPRS